MVTEGASIGTSLGGTQQRIPSWNTAGRPKKAKVGTIGFNFLTSKLECWDGIRWRTLSMKKI